MTFQLHSNTYAVIGDPVSRSLSPVMHNAAYEVAGLDLHYIAHRVTREGLASQIAPLTERFAGFNVTMPLKEEMAALMDELSPEARAAGSVNTVTVTDGGRLRGASTDGAGLLAALARAGAGHLERAVVLGTGGAARAAAAALMQAGASVSVVGRNWDTGTNLAVQLREHRTAASGDIRFVHRREHSALVLMRLLRDANLLVNATPLGGVGHETESPLPVGVLPQASTVVCDMISVPCRTPLLEACARAGCRTIEGVEMLIEQGARSFEIWTGRDAPVAAMRDAARAALAHSERALRV